MGASMTMGRLGQLCSLPPTLYAWASRVYVTPPTSSKSELRFDTPFSSSAALVPLPLVNAGHSHHPRFQYGVSCTTGSRSLSTSTPLGLARSTCRRSRSRRHPGLSTGCGWSGNQTLASCYSTQYTAHRRSRGSSAESSYSTRQEACEQDRSAGCTMSVSYYSIRGTPHKRSRVSTTSSSCSKQPEACERDGRSTADPSYSTLPRAQ